MSCPDALRDSLRERGFEVERVLGRGGMGVVYLATQLSLGRLVAVKVIEGECVGPGDLARFRREALALRSVEHPHVVRILDLALDHAPPYLVMEFVDGARSLEDGFGDLPLERASRFMLARWLLEGLAAVHDRSIVHRDLKPGNVLVDRQGQPRLIDFGLARSLSSDETRHTRDGQVLGTLAYMAPEQLRGEDVGLASDVYSYALIAMEILVGRRLFTNAAVAAERSTYVDRLARGVPDILRYVPDLEPTLARVLVRCVQAEVNARPASARAVLEQWPEQDDGGPRIGPVTAVIAPLGRVPSKRGASGASAPPSGPRAGSPAAMLARPPAAGAARARGANLVLGGLGVALGVIVGMARLRTGPSGPIESGGRSGLPASVVATATKVSLNVERGELVVSSQASAPASLTVRWKTKDGWRELARPAATANAVQIPAGEVSHGLEVRAAGRAVDLDALVQPRLRRLLDLSRPLEANALLRRVWASAQTRGNRGAGSRVTGLLPAGVATALADLGPLLGPALELIGDADLKLALAGRLLSLEAVEAYAARRGVALATHVTPWLPSGWAQRIEAPDDPHLARYNLQAQQATRTLGGRVNGARPSVEWWAHGADWDYFNWAGNLVDRPAAEPSVADPVFGQKRVPAQYCEITWEMPGEVREPHERLLFSIELSGSEDMALTIEVNNLAFPMLTRPPRGGRRDAAWFLSRQIPGEALAPGRNRLIVRPFPLPHAESTPVWIGGVSFIGTRRPATGR